ncbi:hypothetical protein FA95DRAFT_1613696 [Auriscalpium vulgare]|uniref:Uncharacterized protein n=1 Tax=Auriscalpium vulgare TaxID=40419 RepID=A0ACB8R1Z0_9AGAM|nr:hypothetical protein FA95DRAFT_1613696 [Auriscalpium vulgare]
MSGQPLPAPPVDFQGEKLKAYLRCVQYEQHGIKENNNIDGLSTAVAARVVGLMLLHLPSVDGITRTVTVINGIFSENTFMHLPLYQRQDAVSDEMDEMANSTIYIPTLALKRENFRCALDPSIIEYRRGLVEPPPPSDLLRCMESCWILPPLTNLTEEEKTMWYGDAEMRSVIYGTGIERMRNTMLLEANASFWFGELYMWLEPEDKAYRVCSTFQSILGRYPDKIKFNTSAFADDEKTPLPPPDPKVLAAHAGYARVVNLSGVREYIKEIAPETAWVR